MMDGPFFRSQWNQPSRPRYSPSFRGIPVQSAQRKTPSSSPKVVSIPVQFIGLETTRSAAVLKIQKVFRGYLVRKGVKRIMSIKREVDDIERRISHSETADLIRRDAKERLRVNETLMALLFKLDSVRGVDSGVRDCRKTVIRKAIALQERVDAIVSRDETLVKVDGTEIKDNQASEVNDSDALAKTEDQALAIKNATDFLADSERAADRTVEMDSRASDVKVPANEPTPEIRKPVDCSADSNNTMNRTLEMEGKTPVPKDPAYVLIDDNAEKHVDEDLDLHCRGVRGLNWGKSEPTPKVNDEALNMQFSDGIVESSLENCEKMDITDGGVDSEVNANEEACVVKQIAENHNPTPCLSECINVSVDTSPKGNQSEYSVNPQGSIAGDEENNTSKVEEDRMEMQQSEQTEGNLKDCFGAGRRDENKSNRELLERIMEDNEKMMSMMTQLFERNEMQTQMLGSLTKRVDLLERAFMCERLRRKKKRHAVGTADGLETTSDQRKCGKR